MKFKQQNPSLLPVVVSFNFDFLRIILFLLPSILPKKYSDYYIDQNRWVETEKLIYLLL